jgi:hypothetical protein
MVYRLAALFSLDAFAGGFRGAVAAGAMGCSSASTCRCRRQAYFFFWSSVLLSHSPYPVADWLSRPHSGSSTRWCSPTFPRQHRADHGGVRTDAAVALILLLVRAALSQMDVPARSSIRHGGGHRSRARGGGQPDGGAAEPRLRRQPDFGRHADGRSFRAWPLVICGGSRSPMTCCCSCSSGT